MYINKKKIIRKKYRRNNDKNLKNKPLFLQYRKIVKYIETFYIIFLLPLTQTSTQHNSILSKFF